MQLCVIFIFHKLPTLIRRKSPYHTKNSDVKSLKHNLEMHTLGKISGAHTLKRGLSLNSNQDHSCLPMFSLLHLPLKMEGSSTFSLLQFNFFNVMYRGDTWLYVPPRLELRKNHECKVIISFYVGAG